MTVRLNHFILWCKGWYEPVNQNEDVFTTVRNVLKLDGYQFVRTRADILSIVLNYMDDLRDNNIIKPSHSYIRFAVWHSNIGKNMDWYKCDYQTALLYTIKAFFAFEIESKDLPLTAPIYSRKLFNMGLTHSNKPGITYKEMNLSTQHNYSWAV